MNYEWTTVDGVPQLSMRTQTEDERVRFAQMGGAKLRQTDELTWVVACDVVNDSEVPEGSPDFNAMDVADLQTAIAEAGLKLPKKVGGNYRKSDLVAVLAGAES